MRQRFRDHITPAQVIIGGFLILILIGAFVLMLPISSQARVWTPFLEALFTSTSATCVTGLVVHDTATYWSQFGQLVILCLIQIGGMGVVTMTVAVSIASGKKIGLKQRWFMQESISAHQVGGIIRMTGFILRTTLMIELLGAALLSIPFIGKFGALKGLWYGFFHSISAFCNAGFDLQGINGAYSSLTHFNGDILINVTIMALIIVGGIGFLTWDDIATHKQHFRRYRLQSKLAITVSAVLIIIPSVLFFIELGRPTWAYLSGTERFLGALFQSVTTRTAGFNTLDLTKFCEPSIMIMILLMLVGGSSGSTAGGLKTSTLATAALNIVAVFRRQQSPQVFGRRLSDEVVRNAATVIWMYLSLFIGGGLIICYADRIPLLTALFEAASAIATVGLTLGVTPTLGTVSRIVLIFLMYCGRVGGLTLVFAVLHSTRTPAKLPLEQITVG